MSVSSLSHFSTVSLRQASKATGNYFTFVLNKHCHLVMHLTGCVWAAFCHAFFIFLSTLLHSTEKYWGVSVFRIDEFSWQLPASTEPRSKRQRQWWGGRCLRQLSWYGQPQPGNRPRWKKDLDPLLKYMYKYHTVKNNPLQVRVRQSNPYLGKSLYFHHNASKV